MIKGVVQGMKLRIRTSGKDQAKKAYEDEIGKLAHEMAGEFEKELTEAILEEFKPHVECKVEHRRDMIFGDTTDIVSIGYDIDIAMDMRSAARCALANSLVNFKPVEVKE